MNAIQQKAVTAVRVLNARAKMGDKRAVLELAKLRARLAGGALAGDLVVGAAQDVDELRRGDDLELADAVAQEADFAGDDLARKAALRKARLGNLAEVAPFTNQNPPSVLSGTVGNSATVKPGQLVEVANFQTDDAHSTTLSIVVAPVQQQATTNQDFVTAPSALGAGLGNRAFARIKFGNRGFAVAAFVDIGVGQQLDVSGSMCTVEVGLKVNPNITTSPMQLAGMIGAYKPIMRTAPLTFTLYADDTGAVSTNLYPIPPFAKKVWFIKQTQSDVVTLEIVNFAHSPPGNFQYIPTPAATIPANTQMSGDPIILPADAIAISAATAAANAEGRFVFELGI